jgi:hypothetical protein
MAPSRLKRGIDHCIVLGFHVTSEIIREITAHPVRASLNTRVYHVGLSFENGEDTV